MRKRFTQTVLNMVLIAFFIIGFCLGFYILSLPIMASMFTGAGLAMLPLLMFLRKG
jgi:Kef-type K+ transport system membrane component KefB